VRSHLRLGAFFSEDSWLMVRLTGDCESCCKPPTEVEEKAGDGVAIFVMSKFISQLLGFSGIASDKDLEHSKHKRHGVAREIKYLHDFT